MLTEFTRVNGKTWQEAKKIVEPPNNTILANKKWYEELCKNEEEKALYGRLKKVQEDQDKRQDLTPKQKLRSGNDSMKPPYAIDPIEDRLKIEKYADFYEGGALLLKDERKFPTRDFELVFLYHSEAPTASTVPLTILKMDYDTKVFSDETVLKVRPGKNLP